MPIDTLDHQDYFQVVMIYFHSTEWKTKTFKQLVCDINFW